MQVRQRILFILLSCFIAAISGVAVAALLFRPTAPSAADASANSVEFQSLTGGTGQPGELPELFPAPAFQLVDQSNSRITDGSFEGDPWIADFIFTRCGGPCPVMTQKMSGLQKQLPDGVKLVTFSVDPEHDRPDVLKRYADRFDADDARWHFLTTSDGTAQPIYDVATGLKITAIGATDESPILHSEKFLLIDGQGVVRGVYSSRDESSLRQLVADASRLAKGD